MLRRGLNAFRTEAYLGRIHLGENGGLCRLFAPLNPSGQTQQRKKVTRQQTERKSVKERQDLSGWMVFVSSQSLNSSSIAYPAHSSLTLISSRMSMAHSCLRNRRASCSSMCSGSPLGEGLMLPSHLMKVVCSAGDSAETSRKEGRRSSYVWSGPPVSDPALAIGVPAVVDDDVDALRPNWAETGPEPDGVLACLASIMFRRQEVGVGRPP